MKKERTNFSRALFMEITLLVLFSLALTAWVLDIIPQDLQHALLGILVFLGLIPVAKSAGESLRAKRINVDLLATIALFFSFISGEWGSLLFINLMLSSARILGLYTERRVRASLDNLIKLKPSRARVRRDDNLSFISLDEVRIGELVVVNLGEQIPVDGMIVDGMATIDQSSLTGESMPILRAKGEMVFAATVVASGHLTIRTQKVGAQTTFERMIALVESSQKAKTRMRTTAEQFASWYISIMFVVSVVLYALTADTKLVLAVVLVVCADDIAIAIPLAYVVSIGAAARRGIIIKSADFLERAAKITTLIVDKTGTLTMGHLSVKKMYPFGSISPEHLLETARAVSEHSTHPISKAIVAYAEEQSITTKGKEAGFIKEFEGRGIKSMQDGNEILIGRIEFLKEHGAIPNEEVNHLLKEIEKEGNNATFVAKNGTIIGLFALEDKIREGVTETIAILKNEGVRETVMLTGDNKIAAYKIAQDAGIDEYHAGLLPEQKVSYLSAYLGKDKTVAMVGDGVNDAAVLTRADIGIAMGGIGTDAAIESADIVLLEDDFKKLSELRTIARKVLSVAHQNFAFWALINSVGLYFVFTGIFDPSRAAAYNFLTDFIPIINSLRLFRYKH